MFRSHFFTTVITGDFKEKKEKELFLPFTSKAVEEMIRFMYGSGISENLGFATVKNLLEAAEYCGYGALKEAVLPLLNEHVNKDNVCDEMVDFKMRKCEAGYQYCKDLLEAKEVYTIDLGIRPLLASTIKLTIEPFKPKTFELKICTHFDDQLTIQGFGISVGRGSDLKVTIKLKDTNKTIATHELANKWKDHLVLLVYFDKDVCISDKPNPSFMIEFSGNGTILSGSSAYTRIRQMVKYKDDKKMYSVGNVSLSLQYENFTHQIIQSLIL